jgi:hypothetical protein
MEMRVDMLERCKYALTVLFSVSDGKVCTYFRYYY